MVILGEIGWIKINLNGQYCPIEHLMELFSFSWINRNSNCINLKTKKMITEPLNLISSELNLGLEEGLKRNIKWMFPRI